MRAACGGVHLVREAVDDRPESVYDEAWLRARAEPGGKVLGELHLAGASQADAEPSAGPSKTDQWFGAPKAVSCWLLKTGAATRAALWELKMHDSYLFGTDMGDDHAAEWQTHVVAHARWCEQADAAKEQVGGVGELADEVEQHLMLMPPPPPPPPTLAAAAAAA